MGQQQRLEWVRHGPQTLNVCNQSSWYAVSNQTNNQDRSRPTPTPSTTSADVISTYPSTKPLSAYNTIMSTFNEAFPGWRDVTRPMTLAEQLVDRDDDLEPVERNKRLLGPVREPGLDQNDCIVKAALRLTQSR